MQPASDSLERQGRDGLRGSEGSSMRERSSAKGRTSSRPYPSTRRWTGVGSSRRTGCGSALPVRSRGQALRVPWVYLAAGAGVLVLLRVLFSAVIASERLAAKAEEREENSGVRQRLDQFTH